MPLSLDAGVIAAIAALLLLSGGAALAADEATGSPIVRRSRRIKQIAAMLSPQPEGVGRPASDRKTWEAIAELDRFRDVLTAAEEQMGKPVPVVTEEDFNAFSETGRRERYMKAIGAITKRFREAVYAECIENRGRFLPDIERVVERLAEMPTWVPPAHRGIWRRAEEDTYIVDLVSSDVGAMLATADYWLGEKLSDSTRALIRNRLQQRVFGPVRNKVERKGGRYLWWLKTKNNWSSVCLANVVIAATAVLTDRDDRAFFIATAEKTIKNYLKGFPDDGYCSEGLGYWNYGFSHYAMLADVVHQATGGQLDWMSDAHVEKVAMFGLRTEILPGIYPTMSDCSMDVRPKEDLQAYIAKRYRLDTDSQLQPLGAEAMRPGRLQESIFAFPHGLPESGKSAGKGLPGRLREWFDDAQFYVGRPGDGATLALACKGGHNAEHHNHNDVGTYMVAVGSETVLVDPGAPVYTEKTFSSQRYEDKVINSWGHPVPIIDGQLQATGHRARAVLLSKEFTDGRDTLVFDISSPYRVDGIETLTRTFVYDRSGAGSLTVTDKAEFSKPMTFSTALVSYGDWRRNADGSLSITTGDQSVNVTIDTNGRPYELSDERIDSEVRAKRKPLRLGIVLAEPKKSAQVSLIIVPGD